MGGGKSSMPRVKLVKLLGFCCGIRKSCACCGVCMRYILARNGVCGQWHQSQSCTLQPRDPCLCCYLWLVYMLLHENATACTGKYRLVRARAFACNVECACMGVFCWCELLHVQMTVECTILRTCLHMLVHAHVHTLVVEKSC